MKTTFLQVEKQNRDNYLTLLFILTGIWLLCMIVVTIVAQCVDNPASMEMVAVGTLCMLLINCFFRYVNYKTLALHYTLAIRMGTCRGSFLLSTILLEGITTILSLIFTYIFYQIELFWYEQLGIVKYEFFLDGFFKPVPIICFGMLLMTLSILATALFHIKSWLPSVIWLIICLSLGQMEELVYYFHSKQGFLYNLITWIRSLSSVTTIALTFFLLASFIALSTRYLRNKDV